MTIVPINGKILLKPLKPSEATGSGIFLMKASQTQTYEVLSDGSFVKVGDVVVCKRGAGETVKTDEEYLVVDEDSILSKIL